MVKILSKLLNACLLKEKKQQRAINFNDDL